MPRDSHSSPNPRALAAIFVAAGLLLPAAPALAEGHPHGDLFAADCADCHNAEGWTPLRAPLLFHHDSTGFPLLGAHRVAGCEDCHESLVFHFVGTSCADCHHDPHAGELGLLCEQCHDSNGWENQRQLFDVHDTTLFPLLAPHASLACDSCHGDQNPWEYASTPTECADCHMEDYAATVEPAHATAGFSTVCRDCHNPMAARWDEAVFLHPLTFVLDGAHARLGCESCHADGFAGTPTECFSCHLDDYHATVDPNHQAAGFPTMCEACHSTTAWEGALFDHNAVFPLRGAHQALDCESCHADGFAGTPRDCFSCHAADYRQTTDPNHETAGFPTMCESCHGETTWEGAVFDHNATAFPLRGSHSGLDCESCHADGFTGTPTDCFACHSDDYNRADDPDHVGAGFPTTCETCHEVTRWEDSFWSHDGLFPIDSGAHRGEWQSCADCHVTPANFAVFECIFCHEHNRADMDDEHDEVRDYRYESRACFECHPDGRADD